MKKLLILLLLCLPSFSLGMSEDQEMEHRRMPLIIQNSEAENITEQNEDNYLSYSLKLKSGELVTATFFIKGPCAGQYSCSSTSFKKEGCWTVKALKGRESFDRLKNLYKAYSENK